MERVADVLVCVECGLRSERLARGWKAYRIDIPEEGEPPSLAFWCSDCDQREFSDDVAERPSAVCPTRFARHLRATFDAMQKLTQIRRDRWWSLKPGANVVVYVRRSNDPDAAGDVFTGGFVRHLVGPGKGTWDRPGVVIERFGVEIAVPYDKVRFLYRASS